MQLFPLKESPDSPRMFESDFVDAFSRTHPAIVGALFLPAVGGLVFWSIARAGVAPLPTALLFVGGFVVWTLTEYWLHRLLFHWVPKFRWGERMHFLVHGVHHKWPKDRYRLVMPPAVGTSLFFFFMGVFWLLVGPTYVWGFHAGFVLGYVTYDLTHYYIHHFHPRTEFGRALKKHHMLHHFMHDGARFGVSSMFWDRVFGTQGAPPTGATPDPG